MIRIDFYIHFIIQNSQSIQSMSLVKHQYEVGQIVYAKQRGYPPWPSMISEKIKKNDKYKVKFFGWNQQWALVDGSNITHRAHADGIVEKYFEKNKKFKIAENEKNAFVRFVEQEIEKNLQTNEKKRENKKENIPQAEKEKDKITTKQRSKQQVEKKKPVNKKKQDAKIETKKIEKSKQSKQKVQIVKCDRNTRQNIELPKRVTRSASK